MLIYGLKYIPHTSDCIWCISWEHEGIRPGIAKVVKKAGKAGIVSFFFNLYILGRCKGQHPNALRDGVPDENTHQP